MTQKFDKNSMQLAGEHVRVSGLIKEQLLDISSIRTSIADPLRLSSVSENCTLGSDFFGFASSADCIAIDSANSRTKHKKASKQKKMMKILKVTLKE